MFCKLKEQENSQEENDCEIIGTKKLQVKQISCKSSLQASVKIYVSLIFLNFSQFIVNGRSNNTFNAFIYP